jgi:type VI secretion system secreted protein VgrG
MSLFDLDIDGTQVEVSSVRGRLHLCSLFRFEVEGFTRSDPPAPADLVGKPFTLTLHDRFGGELPIRGITVEVGRTRRTLEGASFRFALGPAAEALTVGADCRVFQEMSAVDAVKDVLSRGGISDVRWSLTGSYDPRPYIAQYRESDWHFVERLLAEEGIVYWFEIGSDKTTLVLCDDTSAAEDLPGGAALRFQDDSSLAAAKDAVEGVRRTHRVVTDVVVLRHYDFAKPRTLLEGKAKRDAGSREVYDFPGRFTDPGTGSTRAKVALEARSALRDVVEGDASGVRLVPGYAIEIEEHPVDSINARYLLRSVVLDFEQLRHAAGGEAREGSPDAARWRVRWEAIPIDTLYRPPVQKVTVAPGGPQTGMVVGPKGQEIHPDDTGRVRVQFRWDRLGAKDDTASTWQRVGQFPLGGSMILPRVGWDVLAYHHEEDIDAPFVFAHLYDGEHPVPYALPANKTRTSWQTATTPGGGSTNEIRFEDSAGKEEMFLNASKDQNVVVGNNLDEKVGVDHKLTVGASSKIEIGSNSKVTIGGDQSVTVGASETLTVSGGRNVEIAGSQSAVVGGSRTETMVKGTSLDAKGGRTLTVGGSMIGASAMEVGRSTLGTASVTVGGAKIEAAASGVSAITLGACAETVGGAKIEAAGSSHDLSGKGAVALTVGGANVVAAGGNIGESSTSTFRILIGGAFIGNAPSVSITADSEISIVAGGASLTIKPGSVEVKAPAIALPAGTIDTGGSTIEHN